MSAVSVSAVGRCLVMRIWLLRKKYKILKHREEEKRKEKKERKKKEEKKEREKKEKKKKILAVVNVYLHTSVTAGNVICSSLEFVKISLECIDMKIWLLRKKYKILVVVMCIYVHQWQQEM